MEQSLDDVLNGVDAELEEVISDEQAESVDENPKTEEADAKPTDDDGSTSEPEAEKKDWTFTAYQDEKRKRQELERQIEEMKPKEATKAPDVFDDQDGFVNYQSEQVRNEVANTKAEMSQFFAVKEFGEEKVQGAFTKFQEMIKDNPKLYNEVLASPSPYHEIVSVVDKAEKFEQMKDVDSYEAKVRSEIEQKLRAEYEAKYAEKDARKTVTPSLNSQSSAVGGHEPVDLTLDDILGE